MGFTKISKSFDEEILKPSLYSSQKELSIMDRMPLINLRPITLITFPSNPKIQNTRSDSPVKPHSVLSGTSEKEDVD